MKKIVAILTVVALGAMAAACSKETGAWGIDPNSTAESYDVKFRIGASGGGATRAGTRVGDQVDNSIANAYVIVMEQDSQGDYVYRYGAVAPSFSPVEGETQFTARLKVVPGAVKLLVVANYSQAMVGALPAAGSSEDELRASIAGTVYETSGNVTDGVRIPMTGEKMLSSIVQAPGTVVEIPLMRAMARVDVDKDLTAASRPFTVTSVRVMNLNSHAQVFPSQTALDGGRSRVVSPSVPAASLTDIDNVQTIGVTDDGTNLTYTGSFPYAVEASAVSTTADRLGATCVVVGGLFDTDTDESFYRVDFGQDTAGKFGEILRNYRYVFTVTEVSRRGDATPAEAVENIDRTYIDVSVGAWDQASNDLQLGVGDPYLKIQRNALKLGLAAGEAASSRVTSNVNFSYQVWQNGAQVTNMASLEDFGFTSTYVPGEGAVYSFDFAATTLSENINDEVRRFEVRLFWDDGTLVDTIKFEQVHQMVHILSFSDGYGSIGVWSQNGAKSPTGFGSAVRATIIDPANFGPTGIVQIPGVALDEVQSGSVTSSFTSAAGLALLAEKLEWADIIIVSYDNNPVGAALDMVREWAQEGDHVTWICADTDTTNADVRADSYLGGGLVWHPRGDLTSSMSQTIVQGTIDDMLAEDFSTIDILGSDVSVDLIPGGDLAKGVAAYPTSTNAPFIDGVFGAPNQNDPTDSSNDGTMKWFEPGTNSNIIPVMVMPMEVEITVSQVLIFSQTESRYANECMILGVDPTTRIVYMGDSQLNADFYNYSTSLYMGNVKKMMDNTWAWAIETAMGM